MKNVSLAVQRFALLLLILATWEVSSGTLVREDFVGRPSEIVIILAGWLATGELWPHLMTTLTEAVLGYVIGASAGIVCGIALGLNPFMARVANPVITAVYAIPKVSFAPLLIMAFGIRMASKVALTALIVFFFVFYDTFRGVRSVSDELKDGVMVMGANRWQLFRYIVWPTTLEWIIDGLKISVPYAFIGAVAGEIVVSNQGIGHLIRESANRMDISGLFAALSVLLFFSVLTNAMVNRARRGVSKWRGEHVV